MSGLQDNRGPEIVLYLIILLAVTWISVILRIYVRFWIINAFGADDLLIIVALFSYSVFGGLLFASVHHGLGRHDADLAQDQDIKARMYYALSTMIYIVTMAFIKISIGLLILRVVVARRYTYSIKFTMTVVTLWSTAELLFVIFQCKPVQFQWNTTIEGGTRTGNFISAAIAFSVMSILSDWFYAILPIPVLWPLKITLQSKISIVLILSLGIIASVGPIIRLKYLLIINYSDLLYADTDALIWTIVEPGIGITTASIATFRPILAAWNCLGLKRSGTSRRGGTTDNGGPYITFQNLGTRPTTTHSMPKDTKLRSVVHSGSYGMSGSEEFILPHDDITKTIGIAVVHKNDIEA